jgi:hypothetical protein
LDRNTKTSPPKVFVHKQQKRNQRCNEEGLTVICNARREENHETKVSVSGMWEAEGSKVSAAISKERETM